MSGVAGARKHCKMPINLPREEYSIAVVRQECVLNLMESLEVERVSHAYGRAEITITPCYIVAIFNETDPRIIAIDPLTDFRIIAFKT